MRHFECLRVIDSILLFILPIPELQGRGNEETASWLPTLLLQAPARIYCMLPTLTPSIWYAPSIYFQWPFPEGAPRHSPSDGNSEITI